MFRFAIIICLFVLTACSKTSAPKSSVHEVTGSSPERVAGVSAIITKHNAPPTAILDAHFVEEQTGDGVLGPSDFRAFYFIEVAPQDVSQWMQILTPLGATAEYDAPARPRDWWMARDTFASLQFYKPDILTRESSWLDWNLTADWTHLHFNFYYVMTKTWSNFKGRMPRSGGTESQ